MPTESGSESSAVSFRLIIPRILAIFLLLLPIMLTVSNTSMLQQSDYVSAFYLAGRLVLSGRPLELYADRSSTSLMATPFNTYAHQTMPQFPSAATAVYMYPPLTAAVFAPFACLTPTNSLLVWQVLSMVAFCACCFLLSKLGDRGWSSFFFGGVLFFPIAQNFLLGQLGIILGLLPLSFGYWWLMRGHPLWAGLALSLLCLKPHFLPAVVLIVLSLALAGKLRCPVGFLLGAIILAAVSLLIFPLEVFHNWLLTLKMAGSIYTDPQYSSPGHLVSSLAPALSQMLPLDWRPVAKQVLYAVGVILAGHLLWFCRRLIRQAGDQYLSAIPFVFILCSAILPLILPYLLFYDLSIFALAGMIIYSFEAMRTNRGLMRDLTLAWIFVDVYLIVFMFIGPKFVQPLLLVLILALVYRRAILAATRLNRSGS